MSLTKQKFVPLTPEPKYYAKNNSDQKVGKNDFKHWPQCNNDIYNLLEKVNTIYKKIRGKNKTDSVYNLIHLMQTMDNVYHVIDGSMVETQRDAFAYILAKADNAEKANYCAAKRVLDDAAFIAGVRFVEKLFLEAKGTNSDTDFLYTLNSTSSNHHYTRLIAAVLYEIYHRYKDKLNIDGDEQRRSLNKLIKLLVIPESYAEHAEFQTAFNHVVAREIIPYCKHKDYKAGGRGPAQELSKECNGMLVMLKDLGHLHYKLKHPAESKNAEEKKFTALREKVMAAMRIGASYGESQADSDEKAYWSGIKAIEDELLSRVPRKSFLSCTRQSPREFVASLNAHPFARPYSRLLALLLHRVGLARGKDKLACWGDGLQYGQYAAAIKSYPTIQLMLNLQNEAKTHPVKKLK